MELGEIWAKVAQNQNISVEEVEFLRREGRNTQLRNTFVAGNTTADNLLKFTSSVETVFDIIFDSDTAEITVQIPENVYNHLIILFAGRSTKTGAYFDEILGQFNGDTGSNYIGNQIQLVNTSLSGVLGTAQAYFGVNVAPSADTVTGASGGTFMFIPNIRSSFWKYALALQSSKQTGVVADTSLLSMLQSFWWKDTSQISSIRFFANTSAITAGSNLTVLGIR